MATFAVSSRSARGGSDLVASMLIRAAGARALWLGCIVTVTVAAATTTTGQSGARYSVPPRKYSVSARSEMILGM
jgi:hypothetical protein